ncbi:MAG TPA: hypothetical protein VK684_15325, partial [Edaphobacter sp.]|nr:hypothetical protein [Edaphobacter sp.]
CVERTDRKLSILYRQNEMQETLCYLFPIDRRLPKLNVAGSIPVSRSRFNPSALTPSRLPLNFPEQRRTALKDSLERRSV